MQYTIDFMTDKNIVEVKMKGRLNFQISEKYSRDAVKIARKNDCAKFLIDHSETTMEGGIHKIHTAEAELQQFGFKNTDRVAIIITNLEKDPGLVESLNPNVRWCILKYFDASRVEDAYNWLLESD